MVNKNIVPTIKFRAINPRLAYLNIEVKWFDIIFINVHALTQRRQNTKEKKLYTEMELLLE